MKKTREMIVIVLLAAGLMLQGNQIVSAAADATEAPTEPGLAETEIISEEQQENSGTDAALEAETQNQDSAAMIASEGKESGETPEAALKSVPLDEAHFPDEVFRTYLKNYHDTDRDGTLSTEEIRGITDLYIHSWDNIAELTGIEYLVSISEIKISNAKVENLDISQLPGVRQLDITDSQITKLDLSNNLDLEELDFGKSLKQLTWPVENEIHTIHMVNNYSIDISAATKLEVLGLSYYNGTMDFSSFPRLKELAMGRSHFKNLDVTKNTELKILHVGCLMPQEELDLTQNVNLERLEIEGSVVKQSDGSKVPKPWPKACAIYLGQKPKLELLMQEYFPTTGIDVSGCPKLERLRLIGSTAQPETQESLDLRNNQELWQLWIRSSTLKSLDLTKNLKLKELTLKVGALHELDLSQNTNLQELVVRSSGFSFIDMKKHKLGGARIKDFQTIRINSAHYYDMSKLPGFDASRVYAVRNAVLKGTKLYPTGTKVVYKYYLEERKDIYRTGTVYFTVTGQFAPKKVQGVEVKSKTKDSVSFQWTKAADADGYRVYARNIKTGEMQQKKYVSRKFNSATIKGLKAGETYQIIVRAYKTYRTGGTYKNYYSEYEKSDSKDCVKLPKK